MICLVGCACGIAGRTSHLPWMQAPAQCALHCTAHCRPAWWWQLMADGSSLDAGASAVCTRPHSAHLGDDDAHLQHFRASIRAAVSVDCRGGEGAVVACAYSRKPLGQTGDGHFSPVGGFHPGLVRLEVHRRCAAAPSCRNGRRAAAFPASWRMTTTMMTWLTMIMWWWWWWWWWWW